MRLNSILNSILYSIVSLIVLSVAGTASAAERTIDVGMFHSIVLTGVADVTVVSASTASVVAMGSQEALDRLDIRSEDQRLLIGQKRGLRYGRTDAVTVRVGVPDLRAVIISGAGDMTVAAPATADFSASISGSGDLSLSDVRARSLGLTISGSGTMRASGNCETLAFRVSGSGNILAPALRCRAATVAVSGSGNVKTSASETADIRVSGSGNVDVGGPARCSTRTTGSGTVRCG